jgi:poly-gamma-glutamate capsule biosynthesis protein CapA/YwtB (metallophosphatase superfamily)
MKRRQFLRRLRDALLLVRGGAVLAEPVSTMQAIEQSVNPQRHLKLLLTGDVMTGRGIDQILPHPSDPVLHEEYVRNAGQYVRLAERLNGPIPKPVDYRYIWGQALDVWNDKKPQLRIINLETSITTSNDFWPSKGIHYRMHPKNVACLTAAGIDCCVLANNHVLDLGYAGLDETLATLHASGLSTAGAGRDIEQAAAPARLDVPGGTDVLVFAFADGSGGVPASWRANHERGGVNMMKDLRVDTAREVAGRMLAARRAQEIIIASIHWGGNWGYAVPRQQRQFAHALIDHGVDVVHGHSSHHAKAIEIYQGKPILYGCGDLLNDYEGIGGEEHYRPWLAPMYFVTIDMATHAAADCTVLPMQIRRFRLIPANPSDRQWFGETLNTASKDFGTAFASSANGFSVTNLSP